MATVDVFAPVAAFTGVSAGAVFTDGHALVEEGSPAYRYFVRRGYQIGKPAEPEDTAVDEAENESEEAVNEQELEEIPGMPPKDAKRSVVADFAEGLGIETDGLTIAQIREKIQATYNN